MSDESRKKRERLKQEYKEHYRKLREAKVRAGRAKRKHDIAEALRNMDTSSIMESFDHILDNVKMALARVEARLQVAMDTLETGSETPAQVEGEQEEKLRKARAKETLRQVKLEMGQLYSEIERHAESIQIEKTIGSDNKTGAGKDEQENS